MTVARLIALGMVGAAFWLLGALIVVTAIHADQSTRFQTVSLGLPGHPASIANALNTPRATCGS